MAEYHTVKLSTAEIEDIIEYLSTAHLSHENEYEIDYDREQSIIKKLEKTIGITTWGEGK